MTDLLRRAAWTVILSSVVAAICLIIAAAWKPTS